MPKLFQFNGRKWVEIAKNGKDGNTPDIENVVNLVLAKIPKPENGKDGINPAIDLVVSATIKALKELKGNDRIDVSNIRNGEQLAALLNRKKIDTNDLRWHGGGASAFIQLSDVPQSYTGQAGKFVSVNPGATGLVFTDINLSSYLSISVAATTYVPYTGALANVDLNSKNLSSVNIITVGDGSKSAPAYAFVSKTSTGIYRQSTGELSISVVGIDVAYFKTIGGAVNYFTFTPSTGAAPTVTLASDGTTTDIPFKIAPKGAGDIIFGSMTERKTTAGIVASIVQLQGSQPLTSEINQIATCANVNDTVTLPSAVAGLRCVVINSGAQTLQVFPALGDNLGAGVNNSTTIVAGAFKEFVAYDSTNWKDIS